MAELRSRYMYAAVALFWLDWLEELIDSERDRRFDLAARALSRVPWHEGDRKVLDIRRDFPVTESANPIEVLRVWTLEEYAAIIAPRLRAIEAREPEPKVMPRCSRHGASRRWRRRRRGSVAGPRGRPPRRGPAKAPADRIAEVTCRPEPVSGGVDE